jgi:hypothetical protein
MTNRFIRKMLEDPATIDFRASASATLPGARDPAGGSGRDAEHTLGASRAHRGGRDAAGGGGDATHRGQRSLCRAQHLAGVVPGCPGRGSAGGPDGLFANPGRGVVLASPGVGGAVQHRLALAAQFSITLRAAGGTRLVSELLELSGLSAFVGVSDGVQHALNAALETAVVTVAAEQRTALAEAMAPRRVTVCKDETFHPGICLVAIEPVSNFIVLGQYAADRTAATWTAALSAGCTGLAVEVIQSTADEAKALRRHAETDLGAHHSPELFHGQHEVSKATAPALAHGVAAQAQWEAERAAQQAFEARALICELGVQYHPYDLQDGQTRRWSAWRRACPKSGRA